MSSFSTHSVVSSTIPQQIDMKSSGCKLDSMAAKKPEVIALFDVDGTLTAPKKQATQELLDFIRELRKVVTIGVVGGSDLSKISEQLGKTEVQKIKGNQLQTTNQSRDRN